MYSLTRNDAICDYACVLDDTLPLPPTPVQVLPKISPSHSVSSSSSGSYCTKNGKHSKSSVTSPSQPINPVKPIPVAVAKPRAESISDDEKSEKRYSSSGYYESPHDDSK